MSLTEDFDLDSLVNTADPRIRECFQKNTLAVPGHENISDNTKFLLDWVCNPYLAFYDEKVGFSNVPSKIWPGTDESEILVTKILEIAPGLAQYKDPDSQNMEDSGLKDHLKRRLWNQNLSRKGKKQISGGN